MSEHGKFFQELMVFSLKIENLSCV